MKLLFLIALLANVSVSNLRLQVNTLTPAERDYAVQQLEESRHKLIAELKGLTNEQLKFKSGLEKWSILEIVEHIGLAENGIGTIVSGTLQQPMDTSRQKEIRISDRQIRQILTNRTGKAIAPEIIRPTGRFTSLASALNFFEKARDKNINLIKTTKGDLRHRYWQHGATGTIDLYQSILLISAHCERHTEQIREVKSEFPKS